MYDVNEHQELHQKFDSDCEHCWSEKEYDITNRSAVRDRLDHDGILERYPALKSYNPANYAE